MKPSAFSRGVTSIHGYSSVGREVLEDAAVIEAKESFDVHDLDAFRTRGSPSEVESLTLSQLGEKVRLLGHQSMIVAQRLLMAMAFDLGAHPGTFLGNHSEMLNGSGRNATSLRLLHYPPLEGVRGEEGAMEKTVTRCGVHSDYGGLTLLFQVSIVH